jgi:hypothetical protein
MGSDTAWMALGKENLARVAGYSYWCPAVKNSCRGAAQDFALDTGLAFLKIYHMIF